MCVIVWSASLMRERSQVASNGIWTTDICQTNTDESISENRLVALGKRQQVSEDRLVALGKRQPVNDAIKITIRMKGGAMPRLECGRRRRPAAEVQA
jgi:hypothetical protein